MKVDQNGPEASGGEAVLDIPLVASAVKPRAEQWAMALITVAMPWLCLLTGFWVAFVRSEDPACVAAPVLDDHIRAPDRRSAMARAGGYAVWHGLAGTHERLVAYRVSLFGISFSEPLPFDRRRPWLKLIPIAVVAAFDCGWPASLSAQVAATLELLQR